MVKQEPRALGHEEETDGQDGGDDVQAAQGDLVAGLVHAALSEVVDGAAEDGTDVDPVREQGNEHAAQVCRRRLGRVDVGKGDEEAVRDPQQQTAKVDGPLGRGGDLDGARDGVQHARQPDGMLAAEVRAEEAGQERRDERAQRQQRADQLLERRVNAIARRARRTRKSEDFQKARHRLQPTDRRRVEAVLRVGHRHDAADQQAFAVRPQAGLFGLGGIEHLELLACVGDLSRVVK